MKGSRWFIFFIVGFLILMFVVEYNLPKKFTWVPTFSRYDHEPLGCAVFDSLLFSSLPSGYTVSNKSLYQLDQEDTVGKRGILLIAKELKLTDVDVSVLLNMAKRGNKIMLASGWFSQNLKDTLGFTFRPSFFYPMNLKRHASSFLQRDSLFWLSDSVYARQVFYVYPQFCSSHFYVDSLQGRVLAEKTETKSRFENETDSLTSDTIYSFPVALSLEYGKGEIILVSTPLLLTNYGVLNGTNATYVFRLLSQMRELPIVRSEGYTKETAEVQQSPFRYFLSQEPLRWALYLTMTGILLFMIFTARRRQRAIPVVRKPENKSLEFTELIGTLYYQKKDHTDLIRKKFTYFAEALRREIQVDVEEASDDDRSFRRIAQKTGMNAEEIARFVREVRLVVYGGSELSEIRMKRLIDKMNKIINYI